MSAACNETWDIPRGCAAVAFSPSAFDIKVTPIPPLHAAAPGDVLINNVGAVTVVDASSQTYDMFCPPGQWMVVISGLIDSNNVLGSMGLNTAGRVACSNSTRFQRFGSAEGAPFSQLSAQGFSKISVSYAPDGLSSMTLYPLVAGSPTNVNTYGTAKSDDQTADLACPENMRVAGLFGQVYTGQTGSSLVINIGVVCRAVGKQWVALVTGTEWLRAS